MLVAVSGYQPSPATYDLQVQVVRGADTVSTTFRIGEGLEGRALIEGAKAVTRVHVKVRRAATDGCLHVTVASAAASTKAAVDKMTVEAAPLIQLCGETTGRIAIEGGPSYRVRVSEVTVP
jgi:alpha-D-ribose 1-methylphosphonate 5-triphosphate synthase subunit PhnG